MQNLRWSKARLDQFPDHVVRRSAQGVGLPHKQSGRLLVAVEAGSGFSRHYHEALQRDLDVVMTHAEVATLLQG